MEIPATSYLRVAGASIVDGSGTPVRLGWVVGFKELAGSFRWELCTRRTGLEETLRFEIAKG